LHEPKFEPDEQLYPLAELQIPTGFHVIKFQFETYLNFKGFQTIWKKSKKFTKNLSWNDLPKYEFSWHTCMQENEVGILVSFENKEKSLNLKFKPHNTYISFKAWRYLVR
jgi:hypothetical protein